MSNPRRALVPVLRLAVLCTAWAAFSASAAELKVRILDRDGRPLSDVVVVAQPQGTSQPATPPAPRVKTAVMDQVNKQFVPKILIVQVGTAVTFPNSDTVAHQVYSFSAANRFQLPLYHGQVPPPQVFKNPGLVVLGCNIHDSMIGYIYVAPTPYFNKTDAAGTVTLTDLPAGNYELSIWHPRFNEPHAQIKQTVKATDAPAVIDVRLTRALRPDATSNPAGYDY